MRQQPSPKGGPKILNGQNRIGWTLQLQTAVAIHDTMKGLRALGQLIQVTLQHLGKGIEHRPRIARLELRVVWHMPLVNHLLDLGAGASTTPKGFDNQIVSLKTRQVMVAITREALLLQAPRIGQFANGARHHLWQIPKDMSGMFPPELNLTRKGKVVANKNIRTKRKRRWESFVM